MVKNLVASGVIAGFAAGLIAVALQFWLVQPVLLHAELYESGELTYFGGSTEQADASGETAHDDGTHDDGAHDDGAHDDGAHEHGTVDLPLGRNALTILFSGLVYAGYGLLLVAAMAFARIRGHETSIKAGVLWGIAGFITVQLAPAIGLPPELPGMAAADVTGRQIWWLGTAVSTAGAMWLISFGENKAQYGLAGLLLVVPHLIGAPHPHEFAGPTPPELASLFAARALGVGMAAWAALGLISAWLWQKELF